MPSPRLSLGLVAALVPLALAAQTGGGRLAGVAVDASGAAVPGARVQAANQATGLLARTESNTAGGYVVADLPPGLYSLEIEAEGFRLFRLTDVKVDVGRTTSVPPARLEIGEISETVEVVAGAAQVETSNAELTATVSTDQILKLPLIGRDPLSFVKLQAGVAQGGRTPTTINGQRTAHSAVTLDGINIQDNYIRSNGLDFLPSRTLLDQVAEFSVTTQNGSSAVGGGASQVNFTTRSGTTEYHGAAYWHHRNGALAASDWFSNRQALAKPDLNENFFGGSLGGPVSGLGNKLFFFANFEARTRRAETLVNTQILTPDARRGVFTYLDSDENLRKVNVLSLQGLAVDPAMDALLDRVPGPEAINNFDIGDSDREQLLNTAGYRYLARDDGDRAAVVTRLDYAASDRHLLSGTYKFSREDNDRPALGIGYDPDPLVRDFGHSNFLSAAWRSALSPKWTNELRGGFNLAPGDFRTFEDRGDFRLVGTLFTNPTVNFEPQGRYTDTYNFKNNTAAQLGRHSLRFGVDLQRVRVETFDQFGVLPTLALGLDVESQYALSTAFFPGGIDSDDLLRAESLLSSLGGVVAQASQAFNVRDRASGYVRNQEFRRRYRFDNYAFYLQDDLRLTPRLNLNLGLRWDVYGRFDERDGLMLNPVPGPDGVIATLLSDAQLDFAGSANGRPLWHLDKNNFAPNVGLAWDVFGDGSTAVRAGYAISYVNDETMQAAQNAVTANDGLRGSPLLQNLDRFVSQGAPAIDPPPFALPRLASENLAVDPAAALFTIDPRLRTPYVQQWNFSIQRALTKSTVVEARYLGNKATKLLRGFDFNQVMLRENGFLEDFNRARANGFSSLERTGEFDPEFNGAVLGSRPLFFFPLLEDGGRLDSSTIRELIRQGEPGALAGLYVLNGFTEGRDVSFRPNKSTFVADLISNYSNSSYHAAQLEVRRRLARGLHYQANYSFSKTLTDSSGTGTRFDPFLDNAQPELERARADFDVNHVLNSNFVWQLPWRAEDRLLGGWTLSSIVTWQSGAPLSLLSQRGTVNRGARSGENTADTDLTKDELEDVIQFRMTDDGPFIVAQSAINPRDNSGVAPDGEPLFDGQAFRHPEPGQAGALQRRLFSGPSLFAFDLAVSKTTRIAEQQTIELGLNIENVLNTPTFFSGDQAIDSEQFGRATSTATGPRRIEIKLRYQF